MLRLKCKCGFYLAQMQMDSNVYSLDSVSAGASAIGVASVLVHTFVGNDARASVRIRFAKISKRRK